MFCAVLLMVQNFLPSLGHHLFALESRASCSHLLPEKNEAQASEEGRAIETKLPRVRVSMSAVSLESSLAEWDQSL